MKIGDLKVGDRLLFGTYSVNEEFKGVPVAWLKANNSGVFLAERVIDILRFDAPEPDNPIYECRYGGNSDFCKSNIKQFLNSYDDDWYVQSHEFDEPPKIDTGRQSTFGGYLQRPGFLNGFEDYELDCIAGEISLPSTADIFGAPGTPRLQLFNRKGLRGRPTNDLIFGKRCHELTERSFCDFWLQSAHGINLTGFIGRSGYIETAHPSTPHGVRPKLSIINDIEVEPMPSGDGYRIVPFEAATKRARKGVVTDEEILELMGLL